MGLCVKREECVEYCIWRESSHKKYNQGPAAIGQTTAGQSIVANYPPKSYLHHQGSYQQY